MGEPAGGRWSAAAPAAGTVAVIPLRPLGVGEILDGAVTYVRANPAVTLGLSTVVAVATQLVALGVRLLLGSVPHSSTTLVAPLAGVSVAALAGGLLTVVVAAVLTGMLITVLGDTVLGEPGRRTTLGGAWRRVRPRLAGLVGLALLLGVAVGGVLTVGFVPGAVLMVVSGPGVGPDVLLALGGLVSSVAATWLGVGWTLAAPAYVLEGVGVLGALRRSRRLVRSSWWRVFAVLLLAGAVGFVVVAALFVPFSVVGLLVARDATGDVVELGVAAVGGIVTSALVTPFLAGVVGLLYLDRRIRREAYDLELRLRTGPA